MQEAIGLFLNHLALEKNLKDNTCSAYQFDLENLSQFLKQLKINNWQSVKKKNLIAYVSLLSDLGLAPTTISRHISCFRTFFSFLNREKLIPLNPAHLIQPPRLYRKLPTILSVDEITKILDSIDIDLKFGLRDRTIFELLYGSGLRISELINLRCSSLYLEVGQMRVIGKGGKERIVPVGEEAQDCVNLYLEKERPKYAKENSEDILILSRLSTKFTRMGMFKIIKKRVLLAGITKDVKPHTFRHSFASHLIDGGASLRAVQEMLGHADISTTQIYTQLGDSYLRSVHKEFHPRERKAIDKGK